MNAAKNQRLGKKACMVGKKFKSFLKILLNLAPMHYFSIINPLYSERGWRSLHKQTSGGGGKIQNRMITVCSKKNTILFCYQIMEQTQTNKKSYFLGQIYLSCTLIM